MQYLDSIVIHNFKSFKHASIKFNKGFNCIVGPNGSGKSNLCDSLLFALGESSLRRMRVTNTSTLINSFAKPKKEDGVKRAYVKVNFAGDNPLEVSRIIKSNNKISYRLNGNRVTRQEVVDVLRAYKSEINDTNIIAQGEISSMVNLNSKERRELIDVAAGVKEFNDKKEAAMKELGKVSESANSAQIILNERKGFLGQLEKEKEDAEKYIKLTEIIKRINYTTLKNSEKQTESDFNTTIESIKNAEQRKKATNAEITELQLVIEKLSKEKENVSQKLNTHSVELSGTNKILENINKEIAVKETQLNSLKERIEESDSKAIQSKKDQKKLQEEIFEGSKSVESTKKELEEKNKHLSIKEIYEIENTASSQIDQISKNQKQIDEIQLNLEKLSKQSLQYKFEYESMERAIKTAESEMSSNSEEYEKIKAEIKSNKEKVLLLSQKITELSKEIELQTKELESKYKKIDEIYKESVDIREQIAILGGSSDKANELIKKNISKGFYGRAYELCTYDEKYSLAINASALSRLNYFVVDSAEVAESAIKLLKSKQLGRSSFIPLDELTTKYKEKNTELDALIDYVKFDKRFEKAFNYIFANTYLVESIGKAKTIGFGKGRFVTLEGDLVEPSGIITGGSIKQLKSPIVLEIKVKELESQQRKLREEILEINSSIAAKRKEMAIHQTDELNYSIELKHSDNEVESLKNKLESIKSKAKELNSKLLELKKKDTEKIESIETLSEQMNLLKIENEKVYKSSNSDSKKSKTKIEKGELDKLKALRSEVEELKIKIATLSKEQELKEIRSAEIDNEIKAKGEEIKEMRKKLAILDNELMQHEKEKLEMQQKIGKSDANSQELYKNIQELDSKISKQANEKGKQQSDLEKANRDLIEQETRKVQIQTHINDIKAELLSYQNVEILKAQTQEELDAKKTIAKNDLERLGAVNLKAPEVYESKRKDVEEADSKLLILENEKNSIVSMINEIESKKLNIFVEALNNINGNFKKLYSYIFDGSAYLQLENQKDPFNSGLAIVISSPKNRNSNVEVLSGGEKILVMMMLIFAIQSNDPMSFYVFDEIDISLDKENSKKLSKLMKEISKKSQVIVISHNDSLITAADTAIGVVNRKGESGVVGLQLTPTENIAKTNQVL